MDIEHLIEMLRVQGYDISPLLEILDTIEESPKS